MTFLFLKSSTHEIIFGFAACLSVLLIVFHKSQLGLVTTHLSTFYCRLAASLAFRTSIVPSTLLDPDWAAVPPPGVECAGRLV